MHRTAARSALSTAYAIKIPSNPMPDTTPSKYATITSVMLEITTITDAVIWYINRDAFHNFMRQYPHIMSAFLLAISGQARFLAGKVRSFATKGLQGRVLEHLDNHDSITNIALVAEMLGVARPSLSRILSKMQSDGHIVRTKKGFVRK